MESISWSQYWAKQMCGVPDTSKDVNKVLSGEFFVISDFLYQHPKIKPNTVRAVCDMIFEVEDKFFFAEKDSVLIIYDQENMTADE